LLISQSNLAQHRGLRNLHIHVPAVCHAELFSQNP
jgi:hypothetical protein